MSDGHGNIYVADEDNYLVREVNASTGIISIIAGNGVEGETGDGSIGFNAEVSDVYGLALDSQGNLLVADPRNYVIRKLTLNEAFPATKAASTSSFQDLYLTSTQPVTPVIAQLNTSEFKLNTLSCGLNVALAAGVPCSAAIAFKAFQAGIQTAQFAVADVNNNAIAIGIYTFTFVNGTLTVSPVPPADFVFTATPQNVFVVQGSTSAVTLNLTPEYGYQGTIALSCGTMPKNAICTFTENTATTDSLGDAISTQLAISTNNQAGIAGASIASIAKHSLFWMAFGIPLFGLGLMLRGKDRRRWLGGMLCFLLLGVLALGPTSCAEPIGKDITPVGTYQFTITAADSKANISHTATINLTVQAPAVE
jgi:hypothetical protein